MERIESSGTRNSLRIRRTPSNRNFEKQFMKAWNPREAMTSSSFPTLAHHAYESHTRHTNLFILMTEKHCDSIRLNEKTKKHSASLYRGEVHVDELKYRYF
ncbi:hypothetical protein Tcan_13269 [Toxocara canis]|uniref:Uncharacterized protein n=1 Tax=Toxocara canis TaxID=6265 RepID=A0A0B2VX27_TOXCA|nr:hypothetical protein Tcan_13269 [Toxocara canis]